MAYAEPRLNPAHEFDLPHAGFGPSETPLPARDAEGPSLNDLCPYSGNPVDVQSIAVIDGLRIGYCNQGCRDKTAADAMAWPKTVELMARLRS